MVTQKQYDKIHGVNYGSKYNQRQNQRILKSHNNALLPVLDYMNMIVPQKGFNNDELGKLKIILVYKTNFFL